MEEYLLFVLFALCSGAFMYLLVCTDSNSKSPMGFMRRFIYSKGPNLIKRLFGKKIFEKLSSIYNYIFYTNNRIGQIAYCLIFWSAFAIYYKYGIFRHFGNTPLVSHVHSICGAFVFIFCNYMFYKTNITPPGIITKENNQKYVDAYMKYEDGVLYKNNQICQTCNIIKPARSKHCRICNVCLARFDHHCIWVRQCIGQNNYKYFILFLFTHICLCLYGVFAGLICLYGIALKLQLFKLTYKNSITGQTSKATFLRVINYLIEREPIFVFIIFVCFIFSVTLIAFFIYHLKMIKIDQTTNERVKRNDFARNYSREIKEIAEILKTKKDEELRVRLEKLKMCWKSLNSNKNLGFIQGLRLIFQ